MLTNIVSIAKVLLHLVAESSLYYSHQHAVLAENLITMTSASTENTSQTNLSLAVTRSDLDNLESRVFWKQQLIQNLCLGFSPDLKWDSLDLSVRELLLQRCLGLTNRCLDGERKVAEIVSYQDPQLPWEIYLARCDYGAFMAASSYRRNIECETSSDERKEHYVQNSTVSIRAPQRHKFSKQQYWQSHFLSIVRHALGYMYHNVGTMMKFFAIALVADAEFQRELNCVTSKWPKGIQMILRIVLNSIWKISKAAHMALLPFFLVCRALRFHNLPLQIKAV